MKILAVAATLVVFLSCLEVTLSYPVHAAKPQEIAQAKFQEIAPFKMTGRPGDSSTVYLSESRASMQQVTGKFCTCPDVPINQWSHCYR